MIIELGRYNEIGELLIQNRATWSQGHICYWDRVWRVSVTMAAVCMGVKETGMQTGHWGTYNWPLSWDQEQVCTQALLSKEVLAHSKIERDWKIKRVGALRSQVHWLGGLPMRWHG